MWRFEVVRINGIPFQVAVDDAQKVTYVATEDPRFRTPEGVCVGMSVEQVMKIGAAAPLLEKGWAFHTKLKSGWSASFGHGLDPAETLTSGARVVSIFKR
jgi:hypothetical protein